MNKIERLFDGVAAGVKGVKGRAAILSEANGDFVINDIVLQAPRAHEVLVRVVGAGVCHTDLVFRGGFPIPMPVVLGHEGSGIVEAVGADVEDIEVGDHVVLSFGSCGACPNCAKSSPALCYNFALENFAGLRADGSTPMYKGDTGVGARFFSQSSFATHLIANARNTVVVDKAAPLELLGPLGCGIQTGAGAILNSLGVGNGDKVLVTGGGAVGLSGVMAARIAEASVIVLVEPIAERRALALELGATHVIDPVGQTDVAAAMETSGGITHALDTTGIPAVIEMAGNTLVSGGKLGFLGFSPPEAQLPMNIMSMLIRGVTVKAIIEGDSDPRKFIPQLVKYFTAGKLPFDKLIKRYRFEDINAACSDNATGKAIKPILIMQ
jgi:Zn-dependent alcohol dehydrogenase